MKILYQSVRNGDWMRVIDGVSMITWHANGNPEIHKRDGSKFTLELDQYKVISVS